jgi:hypothetical protein
MSITTWNRLECDVVFDDPARGLSRGLSAELFDPLWLIARQRQMGELRSEDGGSLVHALITSTAHPVDTVTIAGRTAPFDPLVPLEAVVEREPSAVDLRLRIRAGRMLADLLSDGLRDRLAALYPFEPAEGEAGVLLDLAGNAAVDAERVRRALDEGRLRSEVGGTAAETAELGTAVASWIDWYRSRAALDEGDAWLPDAWLPDRLEHRFSIHAQALTLEAPEYPGGRLDWDAFTITGPSSASAPAPSPARETHTLPLQAEIPGMPVVRYWEIEDPRFDVARVSVGPGDATRLLLVEFALTFASDWFLAPVPAPVGALAGIQNVVVTDTFGVVKRIRPAEQVRSDPSWTLWRLTDATGQRRGANLLFIPPPPAGGLESDPIEEVALVRDELANVAWAIETIVPALLGGARFPDRRGPAPPLSSDPQQLVYVPFPALPPDRVPLARIERGGEAWLARAAVVDERITIQATEGRFLTRAFRVRDEEVGVDGIVLARRYQLARGRDGRRHLWISRSKHPGATRAGVRVGFDELV